MRKLVKIELVEPFDLYDITVEDDHCFELFNGVISHNSKDIVGGGQGSYYSSDNIFIVGRQQEKDGSELLGYNFIINVEKSRYVKEKSKIPISVTFEGGINPYSGLIDIALETGWLAKPKQGWYALSNPATGEICDKLYRLKDIVSNADFWEKLLANKDFQKTIEQKYSLYTDSSLLNE